MNTLVYSPTIKIKDALPIYFKINDLGDGGYEDKFFKIKLGSFYIPIPNTKSRLAAVKFHDIHHILTEYPATWKGEVQIGAWEIASGCGPYFAAWLLNFGSLAVGLVLYPKKLFNSFMAGRRIKKNLYYHTDYNDDLLNTLVGDLREELCVTKEKENVLGDYLYFLFWVLFVLVYYFFIYLFIRAI